MARIKRGRKIKHTKRLYRKKNSVFKKIISVILVLIIAAAGIFIGKSAAPPIIKFFENLNNPSADESSEVWQPPVDSSETDSSSQEESEPDGIIEPVAIYYVLPAEALVSEQALNDAIIAAKTKGITSVVVDLKIQGGELNFNTQNTVAVAANAVKGTLTTADIARIINANGVLPVAQMSVLYDNLAPRANYLIGYKFETAETMWLDNNPTLGGKPWISPFSDQAKDYLKQLTDEITSAGFSKIIASDLIFPSFRDSDLNYIGTIVKDTNRHTALTATLNMIKTQAESKNSQTMLKVLATDVITGNSEVFVPSELAGIDFVVEIDITQLAANLTLKDGTVLETQSLGVSDKIKTVLAEVKKLSPDNSIIPLINATSLSEQDYNEVIKMFSDSGYKDYIIK